MSKKSVRELEDANDVEVAPDNFGKAVDHHIRFERREWFENIQKTISDILLFEIGLSINNSGPN